MSPSRDGERPERSDEVLFVIAADSEGSAVTLAEPRR